MNTRRKYKYFLVIAHVCIMNERSKLFLLLPTSTCIVLMTIRLGFFFILTIKIFFSFNNTLHFDWDFLFFKNITAIFLSKKIKSFDYKMIYTIRAPCVMSNAPVSKENIARIWHFTKRSSFIILICVCWIGLDFSVEWKSGLDQFCISYQQ